MRLENFIIVNDIKRRGTESYTVDGMVLLPIGTPLPVILKGKGCCGIGIVSELRITEQTTTIKFELNEISKEHADAYYALYRNQVTFNTDSDDPYEQTDQIIPGMMRSLPGKGSSSKKDDYSSRHDRNRHRSIMSYGGDDCDHWD